MALRRSDTQRVPFLLVGTRRNHIGPHSERRENFFAVSVRQIFRSVDLLPAVFSRSLTRTPHFSDRSLNAPLCYKGLLSSDSLANGKRFVMDKCSTVALVAIKAERVPEYAKVLMRQLLE